MPDVCLVDQRKSLCMSSVRRTFAKLRDRFRAQGAKRLRNNDRWFDIPIYLKRIFRIVRKSLAAREIDG